MATGNAGQSAATLERAVSRPNYKGAETLESTHSDSQPRRANLEEMNDADAQLAAQFGYTPVFKREFGYLSTFSFAVSISGLFATIMTTFSYPLSAGGSASAVWCWLISGAGCMCIAVRTPTIEQGWASSQLELECF